METAPAASGEESKAGPWRATLQLCVCVCVCLCVWVCVRVYVCIYI